MTSDCVFCKIVDGEIPANVVHEDDLFLAFTPLEAYAPVHVLVIPRAHVPSIAHAADLDDETRARMPIFIADVARAAGVDSSGYRVATNHGTDALQSVFHLHWHVMGGATLSEKM